MHLALTSAGGPAAALCTVKRSIRAPLQQYATKDTQLGGWLGRHMDQPALALAQGMGFWSVCISALAWTWVRRLSQETV